MYIVYSFSLKFFILTRITFVDVCYDYYDRYTVVYIQIFISYAEITKVDRDRRDLYIIQSNELDRPN